MRGRKPKPPHLKLISGTKRKSRGKAMVIPPAPPECPSFLSDTAKVEWARVAPALYRNGLLTTLDVMALAGYCRSWALCVEAEQQFAAMALEDPIHGAKLLRAGNGTLQANPLINLINRAAADALRFAAEFGMTPSSRPRIDTTKTMLPMASNKADRFFNRDKADRYFDPAS